LLYGHRWPQTLKDDEESTRQAIWMNVIKNFNDEQIMFALEFCEKNKPLNERMEAWPPNPREFAEYCRMCPKPAVNESGEIKSLSKTEERVKELRKGISGHQWQLANYGDVMSEDRKSVTKLEIQAYEHELHELTIAQGLTI